jgi:hypothetical protein
MLDLFVWAFIALGLILAVMQALVVVFCLSCALRWMWEDLVTPVFDFGGRHS